MDFSIEIPETKSILLTLRSIISVFDSVPLTSLVSEIMYNPNVVCFPPNTLVLQLKMFEISSISGSHEGLEQLCKVYCFSILMCALETFFDFTLVLGSTITNIPSSSSQEVKCTWLVILCSEQFLLYSFWFQYPPFWRYSPSPVRKPREHSWTWFLTILGSVLSFKAS